MPMALVVPGSQGLARDSSRERFMRILRTVESQSWSWPSAAGGHLALTWLMAGSQRPEV